MKHLIAVTLLCAAAFFALNRGSAASAPESVTVAPEKPLLLEANEGEVRTRRVPVKGAGQIPTSHFVLKVDAHNGGTSNMMMMTEHIAPGGIIPTHRHVRQDEIVYIERGSVHATVGDQERDLHSDSTIFIPHDTWVKIVATGTESVDIIAFFEGSDYDTYLRCSTVASGASPTTMTKEQRKACADQGHAEYEGL